MKTLPFYIVPGLWLVSFFFSLPLVEPYEVSRLLALGAAVAALGAVLADPGNRSARLSLTCLALLIGAFLIWCGFTFLWSFSPFITIISWGTLCLLPLWFFIFALMPVTRKQVMTALYLAVGGCALLAVWAWMQFFILPQFLTENGTIRYPFADPNNYAGILNMGLFVALGLSFLQPSRSARLMLLFTVVAITGALMLIGGRMAIVAALICLIVFFSMVRKAEGFNQKAIMLVLATAILIFAGTGFLYTGRVTTAERTIELTTVALEDKSVSTRALIWRSTWEMIAERPWEGSGLGTFFLMYPAVRDPAETYSSGLMAHADPLQFWAETGAPGILLLYAILVAVLMGFIKFLRQTGSGEKARLLPSALFCALLTLALHMHVTFHLYVPSLLAMAGLILGVLARQLPAEKGLLTFSMRTPVTLLLLSLTGFLVVFQTCLFSEMHARQAVELMARGDMQGFSDKVNQAGREGFGLNSRPYILAASIPLGILQTSRLPSEEREKLFQQVNQLLDKGLALSPAHPGAYFSKALLYGAMGRSDEATAFLEQTLQRDPRHAQARAMLGR